MAFLSPTSFGTRLISLTKFLVADLGSPATAFA